jgi:hypothetical protein
MISAIGEKDGTEVAKDMVSHAFLLGYQHEGKAASAQKEAPDA